jgi:hypothetical protein
MTEAERKADAKILANRIMADRVRRCSLVIWHVRNSLKKPIQLRDYGGFIGVAICNGQWRLRLLVGMALS